MVIGLIAHHSHKRVMLEKMQMSVSIDYSQQLTGTFEELASSIYSIAKDLLFLTRPQKVELFA